MSIPADKVPVVCPQCDKRLMVPAGTIGKQGRCPSCKSVFTLEQLYEAEATSASPGFANNNYSFATAPAKTSSVYSDDDFKDEYALQAAPALPPPQFSQANVNQMAVDYDRNYAPSSSGDGSFWNGSILGGVVTMLIAVVWFFGGLFLLNRIFIWPPIMFIIGLITCVKGLLSGNVSGE